MAMAMKLASGASFGQVQEAREVGGLFFSEAVYPPGFETAMHEHADPFLAIILAGSCFESSRYSSGYESPDTPLLNAYPSGVEHATLWGPRGGASFRIEVAPARLEQIRGYAPVLAQPLECRGGLPLWLVGRLHREYRRAESLSPLVMESLTLELLVEIERARAAANDLLTPSWLRRVRELLHDRATEPLSLGMIAARVDVDPSHLARAFRQYFGCTPGDYLRRIRAELASRILRDDTRSTEDVARSVGFTGSRDLTRAFRREYQVSPSAFRALFSAHKSGRRMSNPGPSPDAHRG